MNTPHPSSPAPGTHASRRLEELPPYLRRLLIGSWVPARALSDRSVAWAGKVLHRHLPSKWRRKVTRGRKRQREPLPAIPEQASGSRKRPEEEEEKATVHCRTSQVPRCWFCACAAGRPRKRTKRARQTEHARMRRFQHACGLRRGVGVRCGSRDACALFL